MYVSFYLWLFSPCGPWPLFQFLNLYTVGRTPWTGDQPLSTHRITQTQNKRTQTSTSRVGFEPYVQADEDGSCLRPRGQCDRPILAPTTQLNIFYLPMIYLKRKDWGLPRCKIMYLIWVWKLVSPTLGNAAWCSELTAPENIWTWTRGRVKWIELQMKGIHKF
jgi:hypothetical protein